MIWCHPIAPFIIFIIHDTFPCKFIRPGTMKPRWFICSMKLYVEFVSRSSFQYFFLDVYHFLVITIHEVHHHSAEPPFFKLSKGRFQFWIQGLPMHPTPYANTFLLCVITN